MMKKLIYILLIIITASCNNGSSKTIKYTVKAGNHYANFTLPLILKTDTIAFEFTPDSTWIWPKPQNNGWSKITGIAWGDNHENSVRLVYMMINDSTGVLGYYCYVHGISPQTNRKQKGIMDTVTIGRIYKCITGYKSSKFFVKINDRVKYVSTGKQKGIKTLAHPYIGGRYTINHDWKVTIKYFGL